MKKSTSLTIISSLLLISLSLFGKSLLNVKTSTIYHEAPNIVWNLLGEIDSNPNIIVLPSENLPDRYNVLISGKTSSRKTEEYTISYSLLNFHDSLVLDGPFEIKKSSLGLFGPIVDYTLAKFSFGFLDKSVVDVKDGVISRTSFHQFGKLTGCQTDFNSKGDLYSIVHYNEQEQIHGQSLFIRNQVLKSSIEYRDGNKCGIFQEYNENGSIETEGNYNCADYRIIYTSTGGGAEIIDQDGKQINWREDFDNEQKVRFWDVIGRRGAGDTILLRMPMNIRTF